MGRERRGSTRAKLGTRLLAGIAAGAAGTTALNATTYLDMALRGRPASRTPEQTVETVAARINVVIPGDVETRGNRVEGIAACLGLATGVGLGVTVSVADAASGGALTRMPVGTLGLLFGGVALVSANTPMTALGVSDPRRWSHADWMSDVVPHLAYGFVAALTYRSMGLRG